MTTSAKVTIDQVSRILQMMTGKNPIIDRELAQAIIQNNVRIAPEDEKLVAFWEDLFPGKGEALWQVFRPFYVKPLVLKPALLDLEERVRKSAIFSKVAGVHVVNLNNFDEIEDLNLLDNGEVLPGCILDFWLQTMSWKFYGSIPKSSWGYPGAEYRVEIWDRVLSDSFPSNNSANAGDWEHIENALLGMLEYTGLAICADNSEEAKRFKPFLDLCLAGNFPFGVDKDWNLLVLCW